MTRRFSTAPSIGRANPIVILGDSLPGTIGYGVRPDQSCGEILAGLLRAQGARVRAHTYQHDGNASGPYSLIASTITVVTSTTQVTIGTGLAIATNDVVWVNAQMAQVSTYTSGTGVLVLTAAINNMQIGMTLFDVGQTGLDVLTRGTGAGTPFQRTESAPELLQPGTPALGIIWAGANDPANLWRSGAAGSYVAYAGSGAPTGGGNVTSAITAHGIPTQRGDISIGVTAGDGPKFIIGQAVIVGSGAGIQAGIIGSISGDTLTLVSALRGPVNIGDAVGQGTQPNLQFIAQWLLNHGCSRVIICSSQLLDFPGGVGDFSAAGALTPGGGSGSLSPDYLPLRTLQLGAAQATYTGGTVVYCDLFNAMAAVALGAASNTGGGSTGTNPWGATSVVPLDGINYTVKPGTAESTPSAGGYNVHAMAGNIATATAAGGAGYAVNDYLYLTGGHGIGATAEVATVSAGALATVTIVNPGTGYVAGDVLGTTPGHTSGSGGSVTVSTVAAPNQHLNHLGQWIVANVLLGTVTAQNWLAALRG